MMIQNRRASLALVCLAYVVALAAAALTVYYTESRFGWFIAGLIADLVATFVIFAFSMIYKNGSTYDPYWHLIPPVLYLYWASGAGTLGGPRTTLVLVVVLIWSLRLTTNWITDWPGLHHEDWRYVEFREKYGKAYPLVSLGGIHLFPTAIVALASVPAWIAVSPGGRSIGVWDLLGALVSLGGALLSLTADAQMRRFRRSGKKGVMTSGLWGISRHPNYLGEILFWVGLYFLAVAASPGQWWSGAGALAMILMFSLVSGPWMERKILKTRPEYQQVIDTIPAFIPLPGRSMAKVAVDR